MMSKVNELYLNNHVHEGETSYSDIIDRLVRVFDLKSHFTDEELKTVLYDANFVPSSAIILNATDTAFVDYSKRDIFSCFMYSIENDIVQIATAVKHAMLLTASGGGIGVDFSKLSAKSQNKKTNGVIPFMKAYATSVGSVNQADTKKGNCTLYLDINHPEINQFLEVHISKGDDDLRIKNSFTAVKIDDAFMEKVRLAMKNHDLESKELQLLDKIVTIRKETGRPFIYFTDNVNRGKNEAYKDYNVEFSNLCTEVLLATEPNKASVCCLGSLNFNQLLTLEKTQMTKVIQDSVRLLKVIYEKSIGVKRSPDLNCPLNYDYSVGLGIFGYIDYVERIGAEFDDQEPTNKLIEVLDIANSYGISIGLRQVTAIAPNERIARLFDASLNIEHYPANKFVQKDDCGSVVSTNTHKHIVTSYTSERRISFVAKIQKYVHQSISFTLFYDNETSLDVMVNDIYQAWKQGIKTLYYVKTPADVVTGEELAQINLQSDTATNFYNDQYGTVTNLDCSNTFSLQACNKCGG